MFGLSIHICVTFSSKWIALLNAVPSTKLDFSNESNPPPLVKTVSDPVIGIKKKAKCFDNKWPFEDYRSRLSEAEILIFENKKEFSMGQVVGDLSSIWSPGSNQLCFNHKCLLMYVYFDVIPIN